MPSVSNIAIGSNLAAAAADKARHGMNESIARLSTGVRAMYGGDAAGHSLGTSVNAIAKSLAVAARNVEDGISLAQQGEGVLMEIGNIATRMRELGILSDNNELHGTAQTAAITAEVLALSHTADQIINKNRFNGFVTVGDATATQYAIGYGSLTASTTNVGPNHSVQESTTVITTGTTALDGTADADALLEDVAIALGNIAADLTALKSFQAVASNTSANMAATGARMMDTDFATETAELTKNSILNQAAMSMTAQANQAQSAILAVLQ